MTRINITDHAVTRFRRRFPDYVVPGVNARKQLARLVPLAAECKPYLIDTALFAELVEKYGENFPTYLRYKDMYMIFVKNTMVTVYSVLSSLTRRTITVTKIIANSGLSAIPLSLDKTFIFPYNLPRCFNPFILTNQGNYFEEDFCTPVRLRHGSEPVRLSR